MKSIERLRTFITKLLTSPLDELGRWARFVRYQLQLWPFCARRLHRHNAMAMSAALCFRTLFALVPMLVLAIILLKPLGYTAALEVKISDGLTSFGVPTEVVVTETQDERAAKPKDADTLGGETIGYEEIEGPPMPGMEEPERVALKKINLAGFIERQVTSVERKLTLGRVGPIGVLLLIWTVMALLTSMERSLNRIFDARHMRPLPRRVMLYWSVITLCPLLLATAIYIGHRARDAIVGMPLLGWLLTAAGWLIPILVGFGTLALIYTLMTNTKVKFTAALSGAVIVIPLWLVAKWAFGLYVRNLVGPTKIYGVLGLLPLFLIWVNISWWLFLFGAEIAHTVQDLPQLQGVADDEHFVATAADALAVVLTVTRRVQAGEGPARPDDVAKALQLPTKPVAELLVRLREAGVVSPLDTESDLFYVLARPPEQIPVADIYHLTRHDEAGPARGAARYYGEIAQAINAVTRRARGAFGDFTLADAMTEHKKT